MKGAALLFLGLLTGVFSLSVHAAAYSSYQGSAYRNINGTTYWKGDNGSVSESRARVLESVRVGGTYVAVPHIGEVGAAAATAIIAAARSTPGAIVGSALLAWMMSKGLEYIDGQWVKSKESVQPSSNAYTWTDGSRWATGADPVAACKAGLAEYYPSVVYHHVEYGLYCYGTAPGAYGPAQYGNIAQTGTPEITCPSGYTKGADNLCWPNNYQTPGESDWDKFNGVTPPDAVMNDVCKRLFALDGKGCRVTNAGTQTATAPLSDYYTDGSGDTVRQVAKVSPAPTADDPFRTMVETSTEKQKTTVDPVTGQPTTTTETAKNENEDFCTLHPDSIVCAKLDTPAAPDITNNDKTLSITPDSGWGPSTGTCPADHVEMLRNGGEMRTSYDGACRIATGFRPVVIGFAWLAAILIAIGITKRYG